ncbi:MAG: hypothetical protein LBK71_02995 [Verrucomicrobiales bacterium]|jgi:hypothetical protein|nr:hypothetical protein [Verrucomicrobiales bacterium]
MKVKLSEITFEKLDLLEGIVDSQESSIEEYPLPSWYKEVKSIPLNKLQLEDVCKACRQGIHLVYVIPLALNILKDDSLAGDMYEGELLVSMKTVPSNFWTIHKRDKSLFLSIVEKDMNIYPNDIASDVKDIINKIKGGFS